MQFDGMVMSLNNTDRQDDEYDGLYIFTLVCIKTVAILILVLNGALMVCLLVVKHNIPRSYSLQITWLCLVDILTGLSVMLLSFNTSDWVLGNTNLCAFSLLFSIMTQLNGLYTILAICITRFVILIRSRANTFTKGQVILVTVTAVLVSTLLSLLPYTFLIPSSDNIQLVGCSPKALFRLNYGLVFKLYFGTYLVPLIVTNVMYTSLFISLKRKERRTAPVPKFGPRQEDGTSSKYKCKNSSKTLPTVISSNHEARKNAGRTLVRPINVAAIAEPMSCAKGDSETNIPKVSGIISTGLVPAQSKSPDEHSVTLKINEMPTTIGLAQRRGQTGGNDLLAGVEQATSSRGIQPIVPMSTGKKFKQKRTLVMFGLILLFLNIFTWFPILTLLIANNLSNVARALLFTTISCNSLINPIIYTIQIVEFRKAVFSTVVGFLDRVRLRCFPQ